MAASSSSSRYNRRRYSKEEIARMTHCICKFPIYEQVSWTPENPGRRFKACPTRNKDKKCEVYGFLDDELPSEYYKDLMFNLHMDNKKLESNIDALTPQDESEKLVSNKRQDDFPMEAIYQELKELKLKAKVYDMYLVGCVCFMVLVFIFVVVIVLVSVRN